MAVTRRDLVWGSLLGLVCVTWMLDHLQLQCQVLLHEWAWEMHPPTQRLSQRRAGGAYAVPDGPEFYCPVDSSNTDQPLPFSFIGQPSSGTNFEDVSGRSATGIDSQKGRGE
ncbi:hypothetical protein ETAA8_25600 [Anatilimnocola aggregata]|uniref:Uncharacterized protein n=1 Tax=Anatilimnocola aggregata TaxID=2528021 RepID=A0A517YBH4_9BACT|nr:hypothetical protein ETAA8_25600 [Anatilimnocola aggregata]